MTILTDASDCRVILNFHAVAKSVFYWKNQYGQSAREKPTKPSVRCEWIDTHEYATPYKLEYPAETLLERAVRLDLLDVWTPVCIFKFNNPLNNVKVEGALALTLDTAYRAWRFKK